MCSGATFTRRTNRYISAMPTAVRAACFHCGTDCQTGVFTFADKDFCCAGCVNVYGILHSSDMEEYYCLNESPGMAADLVDESRFAYLDQEDYRKRLLDFAIGSAEQVTLYLPQIHCSSCLWLLEHLEQLNAAVIRSTVNFSSKHLTVSYDPQSTKLSEIVALLARIGYEPHIDLAQEDTSEINTKKSRKAAYKLGVAGFCFSNIMLIAFPEYLGLDTSTFLGSRLQWISMLLSLPVVFYAAQEFFVNAAYSIRQRMLNIDLPVALAIAVTFIRSVIEVVSGSGAGYFDSMSGIVFFMLLGRTLQNRSYSTLNFKRDFQSYFPISINRIGAQDRIEHIQIAEVDLNDRLLIGHQEIIPVDGLLSKGKGYIDYSFVTGEDAVEEASIGSPLYAGGRNVGKEIEVIVSKKFNESSFIRLWNNEVFSKENKDEDSFTDVISRYFSLVVLLLAGGAFVYWSFIDISIAWRAATAVLIIACPCALLLSATFTNGYLLSALAAQNIFLRNASVVERLAHIDHIAFDKTGTLTEPAISRIQVIRQDLDPSQLDFVLWLMRQSGHPLSVSLVQFFGRDLHQATDGYPDAALKEVPGAGIEAWYEDRHYRIGSSAFVTGEPELSGATKVYVGIDKYLFAEFSFGAGLRDGVPQMVDNLRSEYQFSLVSGDTNKAQATLKGLFPENTEMYFESKPQHKLDHIASLQEKGKKVMMIGDGLNDAGALKKSDVGLALVYKSYSFSPACDIIMRGADLPKLPSVLALGRKTKKVILVGFAYSLLFNVVGLSYALSGSLSPLVAAIIMPLSSLGIVCISWFGISKVIKNSFPDFSKSEGNADKNHIST